MKHLFLSAIALSMVFFSACEKEETTPYSGHISSKNKEEPRVNKSSSSELATMAKAAGIEEISATEEGYEVSFHNLTNEYQVEVISFDMGTSIEYEIVTNDITYEVIIDVISENIYIEGIGNKSFVQFSETPISEERNALENLTAFVTAFHALEAETNTFDDNGSDDVFPTEDDTDRKFWGRGPVISFYAVNSIPCGAGSVGVYGCRDRYRLWINFGPGQNGCRNYCI